MFSIKLVRFGFIAVILASLLAASLLWQARPFEWSDERYVTGGLADSRLADVKRGGGGLVHLVWEDDRTGSMEVYYKRSADDGLTWGRDIRLSQLTPQTVEPLPRIVAMQSIILVLFSNRTEGGERVFYVLSHDGGVHFSKPMQLSFGAGDQNNPAAAIVGRTIHVVWQSYLRGQAHVTYIRSLDGGLTWERELSLTDSGLLDRHPSIAATGSNVFVSWARNDLGREAVFFKASRDSGETWQKEIQLSSFEPPIFLIFPSIGSNGTAVHVVWNLGQLYYSRSIDGGVTWDPPTPLTYGERVHLAPEISVKGSEIRIVSAAILTEGEPRHLQISADIQYLQSLDGGTQWTEPLFLTEHASEVLSLAPAISSEDGDTFVAWQDNRRGSFGIFIISNPDFAVTHAYEQELMASLALVLSISTAFYVALEVKHRQTLAALRASTRRRPRAIRGHR